MTWHSTKDEFPTVERKQYLICSFPCGDTPYYDIARFSNELSSVDGDLADANHPGFYGYDSEVGYYEKRPHYWKYWAEIPPLEILVDK